MAKFYFNISDKEGRSAGDSAFDYPTLAAAVDQAKCVLAEMALDGIPERDGGRISVEVADIFGHPVVTLSIVLMVDYSEGDAGKCPLRADGTHDIQ